MIPWYHGTMDGTMVSLYNRTTVPRYHGTFAPWYHGTVVPWYHATMVPWYHGTMVPWYHGTSVSWYHGRPVYACLSCGWRWGRRAAMGPNGELSLVFKLTRKRGQLDPKMLSRRPSISSNVTKMMPTCSNCGGASC